MIFIVIGFMLGAYFTGIEFLDMLDSFWGVIIFLIISGTGGFAGRELSFKLEDDSVLKLQGPWHSNGDSLFINTGVDIRDKFYTYGFIYLDAKCEDGKQHYKDVLYFDQENVLGSFQRIEDIAQEISNHFKIKVRYGSYSRGGSCHSHKEPESQQVNIT